MSGDFQDEIECLGIEASPSFVREPEGNGVAERFIRTLKENLLMEWSGRAQARPARHAGTGHHQKEHRHVQQIKRDYCHDGQRYRQELPPCLIGMEACVGAHHLSRKLQSLGHDARPMPARYVRAYL
jgi:transposase InsO family protein